jgi:hypothetical protein
MRLHVPHSFARAGAAALAVLSTQGDVPAAADRE